jgi:hypothetical protein
MEWLLEKENPSIRYAALTRLQGKKASDPEALAAKAAIMKEGTVPLILKAQAAGGHWGEADSFYVSKYKGTVWQLIVLAEHFADGNDPRVKKACEFILENSQEKESGGFAMHRSATHGGGRQSEVIPCLTGNMVFSLLRLGYGADPRLRAGVEWIAKYQRFDDSGGEIPTGWPYERYEMCWGAHSCHMGVIKALKALAEIPAGKRNAGVKACISKGVEFVLAHRVHKRSHDLSKVSRPGWLRFGFPLMYQTDLLEILSILAGLGVHDERMSDAVEALLKRRGPDGKWNMADNFNGRFVADIEEKGKPSKWITLRALTALKGCLP